METFDVVIVGSGIMGASVAWHLVYQMPALRIAIVERDPSFARAASTATNSCIRQQFSTAANVAVSRYAAEVIADFPAATGDPEAPRIALVPFGYLYLAADAAAAERLRAAQGVQRACGAATRLMTAAEVAEAYPFYALDDIVLASHNTVDEGYFDGHAMWTYWLKNASRLGVERIAGEVTALQPAATGMIMSLADGRRLACATLVNAAGPRADRLAGMAGLALGVEPRKRFTYVFRAARPLDRPLPLTIDPGGVHVRSDGALYMAGAAPWRDGPVDPDDFEDQPDLWMDRVWPALARRVPAFEEIRLERSWVGHYDWNAADQNALLGPHPDCPAMMLCCGFSGHGLQQAPAMGRGMAELIARGRFTSLDLGEFSPTRLSQGNTLRETAVI